MFAMSAEALVDGYSCKGVYVCLLCCVQDMCTAEATASLLQVEETFSACLARMDALILKPLLQAGRSEKTTFLSVVLALSHWHTYERIYNWNSMTEDLLEAGLLE